MAAILELELPPITDQHAFNLSRWERLCANPTLVDFDCRIETDRYGQIIMTLPPGLDHGGYQSDLVVLLWQLLPRGRVITECPISTSDGIKAADVIWISRERLMRGSRQNVLVESPEICVEILAPSNTRQEIEHKKRLYFEAGAAEVWLCDRKGRMYFFLNSAPDVQAASVLCPEFPKEIAQG
jgi:Uma2 family endonuclease